MNVREYASTVFDKLNENQLEDFLLFFADDNTLARFESDMIANGFSRKRYKNFKEVMEDLDKEDENDWTQIWIGINFRI